MPIYSGKYLRVDLEEGSWNEEIIYEEQVQQWLLGSGFAARLFYDQMDISLDPLAPRAPLLVFNGLLAGTFAPTGCRSSWCGRSPLTGIWNEANLGGHWGAELRFAGFDGLVIIGKARSPIYLWINGLDNTLAIRDASHLWGKDYFETADTLIAETDPRAQVAGIGPAGENLVKIAGIMSGPSHYVRAAARGGMGALMGSKLLKAIVVRGNQRPVYPDKKKFRDEVKQHTAVIKAECQGMSNLGTAGGVIATEKFGDLPIRNWTLGSWEAAEQVSGQAIYDRYLIKHTHCFACPIGCGKEIQVDDGDYASPRGEGVEYETIAGFAGLTCNANVESVILANSLCNRYGLDTISTASVIAFAMEAFERRLIGHQDTGGIDLAFGDPDAIIRTIKKIAFRVDIGDVLAEGVRAAARQIGQGSDSFAIHVKGLEVAYHDPRAFTSMAVNYATANRGGCHLEALTYWNGYGATLPDLNYPDIVPRDESTAQTVSLTFDYQNFMSVFNPLGLCKFIAKNKVGPNRVSRMVNSALGLSWNPVDLLTVGERIFQLKRLINLRLGITCADDILPPRLLEQTRPSGGAAGVLPDMRAMLPIYYRLRGWDSQGVPTATCLEQCGLLQ